MNDTTPFPVDYDAWRHAYDAWRHEHRDAFRRSTYGAWPHERNVLADAIIERARVNGREVELSDVTMPDFSQPAHLAQTIRYVGIAWGEHDGAASTTAGGVVATFAELNDALGLT